MGAGRAGDQRPPARGVPRGAARGCALSVLDRVRECAGVAALDRAGGPVAGTARPGHVWYVSYGSNLLRERFEVYLVGGTVAGLDRTYPGGAVTAPASDDRPVVLPGRLRFALDAPPWGGGGVAFWDDRAAGPGVLARAWRVTLQQYLEVVHLENGGVERRAAPWPAAVLDEGSAVLHDGWYGRLVLAGHLDGEPALTFTHPDAAGLRTRTPSDRYAGVVARGLVETFGAASRGGLTAAEAGAYLLSAQQG